MVSAATKCLPCLWTKHPAHFLNCALLNRYPICWPGECCLVVERTFPLCSPSLNSFGGLSSCYKVWEGSISSYQTTHETVFHYGLYLQRAPPWKSGVMQGCARTEYDAIGGKFSSPFIHYKYILSTYIPQAALMVVMVSVFLV